MPEQDRIHRLLKIMTLLQGGKHVNTRELAGECGVTRRTIFRDIEQLREAGLEIESDEQRNGYLLRESRFLLPPDLNTQEVLALILMAQDLADAQRGIAYLEPARMAAFKLVSVLPRQLRKYIGDSLEMFRFRLNPQANLQGTENTYETLLDAMHQRYPVQIEYRSFTEQHKIETVLKPYRFVFNQRSWYIVGYSSLHHEVRTFHLKRIVKLQLLPAEKYVIPARFDIDAYFGQAWNMIRDKGNLQHVVIKFCPLVAQNVAEVQWHKTQRIEHLPDGSLEYHVDVEGLTEIVWWILGYGKEAEVLEPDELKQKVRQHAEQMLRYYADGTERT